MTSTHNNSARVPGAMREKRAGRRGRNDDRHCVIHCRRPDSGTLTMLAPKAFLDALSGHASRLFNGETPVPRAEFESQFKVLLQSGFSKLDLVSREEFDSQMVVLARTRARLEALEAKMAELEAKLNPAVE
jgi:BMFP domain-containing protein YqiC